MRAAKRSWIGKDSRNSTSEPSSSLPFFWSFRDDGEFSTGSAMSELVSDYGSECARRFITFYLLGYQQLTV